MVISRAVNSAKTKWTKCLDHPNMTRAIMTYPRYGTPHPKANYVHVEEE